MTGPGAKDGGTPPTLTASIGRVSSILCIPYGYTVSLGCAALLSASRVGVPSELDVLLFALGGVGGFVSLASLGRRCLAAEVPMRVPSRVVFNLLPLVAVLTIFAVPTARLGRDASYFLNAFLVTAAYVLALAVFVRLLGRRPAEARDAARMG